MDLSHLAKFAIKDDALPQAASSESSGESNSLFSNDNASTEEKSSTPSFDPAFLERFATKEDEVYQTKSEAVEEEKPAKKRKAKAKQEELAEDQEDTPDAVKTPEKDILSLLDEEEIDFNAPPKSQKKEESDKEDLLEDYNNLKDSDERETYAKKHIKEVAAKWKQERVKAQELSLEKARLEEELQSLKSTVQPATNIDFRNHEAIKPLVDKTLADINGIALTFSIKEDRAMLRNEFGSYVQTYLEASKLDEVQKWEALETFKEQIDEKYGTDQSAKVIELIARNAPVAETINEKIESLNKKAQTNSLSIGYDQYVKRKDEIVAIIDDSTSLPDDYIDDNPHAPESILAKKIKQDPQWKKQYEAAKEAFVELVVGPKEFSQDDLDKLEAAGHDVNEFKKNRRKQVEQRNKVLTAQLLQGLLLRPLIAELSKKAEKSEGIDAEEEALFKSGKSASSIPSNKPAKVYNRHSAFDSIFKR